MSNELPHALLQCSDCGTTFRVTLKKGRVPSKPIPCPKCKQPIVVAESDIVHPGAKTANPQQGGELRQTQPGVDLRKTKLVEINDENVAALMGPPTGELLLDPPTAEVEVDGEGDVVEKAADSTSFGIINRKKIRPRGARDPDDAGATAHSPGVHVVKGEGRGRRDNVFGQRTANSTAIGRIATKQIRAADLPKINIDDPDLPAAAGHSQPIAAAPAPEALDKPEPPPKPEAPEKPKKLDLSRLRRAMKKLEAESEARDEDDSASSASSGEPDLKLDLDDILSEASEAIDSEPMQGKDAEEPLQLIEASAPDPALEQPDEVDEQPDEVDEQPDEIDEEPNDIDEGPDDVDEEAPAEKSEPDDDADLLDPSDDSGSDPDMSGPLVLNELGPDSDSDSEWSAGDAPDVEPEGYELGDAQVPDESPKAPGRGRGGLIAGVIVLLIIVVVAWVAVGNVP